MEMPNKDGGTKTKISPRIFRREKRMVFGTNESYMNKKTNK